MKTSWKLSPIILLFAAVLGMGQAAPGDSGDGDLKSVLARMNANAANFKSAQADFDLETYESVVQEKTVQKGRIYFRRDKHDVEAAFNLTSPAPKQVVFKDGKISIYEQNINQVTQRDVSKNKADVEAFLSLGFGARGDDLQRDYEVALAGWEPVNTVKTAKLELVPKNEKLRRTYNKIVLWIDPVQDVLLQQQFLEPSGNYRMTRYSNMKVNTKIPEEFFKLKTSGKPRK